MGERGKQYEDSFKRDAVDHLIRSGKSKRQIARDLGISEHSLKAWKDKYLSEEGSPQSRTRDERLAELERENRELREEREILKKSMAIFLKPRK